MEKKFHLSTMLNLLIVTYAFVLPLSRASVGIATVLILVLFVMQKETKASMVKIWQNPTTRSIILFVLFYFLSLLLVSPDQWKQGVRYLVPYLYLLPAIVMMIVLKKRYIAWVLFALIAGMFVSEVVSYAIFFDYLEKSRVLASNPSPFMHHIQYSTFLALGALMLLDMFLREKRRYYRLFYLLFFVAIVGTLFLINARTGQIAFLVGLFILGLMHFQNKGKAVLISTLFAVLVLGSAYGLSENFRGRINIAQSDIHNMIKKGNYATSLGYRVGVTMLSVPLIEENPILGTGVIDTIPLIRKEAVVVFPDDYWLATANHLQNQYLQVLVEIGVVGLGLFLMMLYKIARIPLRSEQYRNLKIILLSVYLFTMFSDVQLHIQFTAGLFSLITGVLLAQSRVEYEEHIETKSPRMSYG